MDSTQQDKKLSLWATYYYIPSLTHDEGGIGLLDAKGKATGLKLAPCDWCNAAIQGTVFIKKGNENFVLNYAGRSEEVQYDCRECPKYKSYNGYEKTGKVLWGMSSGYGDGVKNYKLVPFKTIAVDQSVIPYGSVIFIPGAKDVKYKFNGQEHVHDGYFFAGDTGSKIIGDHIDVFIGNETVNPFPFVKSKPDQKFEAYMAQDKKVIGILTDLHLKGR